MWQRYASATAAAFAKELLLHVPKSDVETGRRIDKVLETVRSSVDKLNDKLSQAETRTRTEKVNNLLQQLNRHPHEERKNRNLQRVAGTCKWFTNHKLFQQWLKDGTSLWVTADPGCGKSVLARYLIDVVLLSRNRRICYFFFKDDFDDQKTAASAGCAMLYQVLTSHRDLITDDVLRMCEVHGTKLIKQFSSLWEILTHFVLCTPGQLVCVIDALDECRSEDRLELVQSISGCMSTSKIKVLFLSRPYFSIERNFDQAYINGPVIRLSGENDKEREEISKEIDIVLDQRIKDFCNRRDLNSDDKDFLLQKFTSIPQRTYLWAHLTMAILEDTPGFTRGNTRRILENIPSTVDAVYEKILQRSVDPSKTRVILQLIVASNRAFTVTEMGIMLALDGHQSHYRELEEFLEPEARFRVTLREICGLFVTVVDQNVYLLHQTAREFLLSDVSITTQPTAISDPDGFDSNIVKWKHSFLDSQCHRTFAERCLWLMNIPVQKHTPRLLRYAVGTWIDHLESSNIDLEDDIFTAAVATLEPSAPNLRACFAIFWSYRPLQWEVAGPETGRGQKKILSYLRRITKGAFPLVMASIIGSRILVNGLLVKFPQRWTKKDLSQAFWWCMCYSAKETAKLLLEQGADVNTMANCSSGYGESTFNDINTGFVASLKLRDRPLYMAICHQEQEMVKLLLSRGANPNLPCQDDFALFAAVERADVTIIRLLCAHGANPAIQNTQGQTSLHQFVKADHSSVSETDYLTDILDFLWSGISENTQYNVNLALHHAIVRDCRNCVRWCLQNGADIYKEINGTTPVDVARRWRNSTNLRILGLVSE